MSTYHAVTDSSPNTLWYSKPFPIWNFEQVRTKSKANSKYLTSAWYKNKPSILLAWRRLIPMDDSEPYMTHRSVTQGLILKSCDQPFEADLNRLSTCQYPARSLCFTHTTIKLLTLPRLSLFDKTLLFESWDYWWCSGQLCHTKFTCLVFIVWSLLLISSPHTWCCDSVVYTIILKYTVKPVAPFDCSIRAAITKLHPITQQ